MNKDFPRIITFLRKERGLSQKQVAGDMGISQALLSHYEKGIRECGLDFLVKTAEYYGVSTDYLLGRPDAKPPADPVEEFVDKVQMKEQEQIILKKWLALDEKQRRAVFDFMVDIVHEYESVQSTAQKKIKKTDAYNTELAIARSSESNYKPAPTEEQYSSFEECPDDMID